MSVLLGPLGPVLFDVAFDTVEGILIFSVSEAVLGFLGETEFACVVDGGLSQEEALACPEGSGDLVVVALSSLKLFRQLMCRLIRLGKLTSSCSPRSITALNSFLTRSSSSLTSTLTASFPSKSVAMRP